MNSERSFSHKWAKFWTRKIIAHMLIIAKHACVISRRREHVKSGKLEGEERVSPAKVR